MRVINIKLGGKYAKRRSGQDGAKVERKWSEKGETREERERRAKRGADIAKESPSRALFVVLPKCSGYD
ncbi:hypothetical protein EBB07_01275 [Paenibacillaceae bacterium]|nr:hypothetical protein EBB07_01275 [Paenibacillaceae bacterium]